MRALLRRTSVRQIAERGEPGDPGAALAVASAAERAPPPTVSVSYVAS